MWNSREHFAAKTNVNQTNAKPRCCSRKIGFHENWMLFKYMKLICERRTLCFCAREVHNILIYDNDEGKSHTKHFIHSFYVCHAQYNLLTYNFETYFACVSNKWQTIFRFIFFFDFFSRFPFGSQQSGKYRENHQ